MQFKAFNINRRRNFETYQHFLNGSVLHNSLMLLFIHRMLRNANSQTTSNFLGAKTHFKNRSFTKGLVID